MSLLNVITHLVLFFSRGENVGFLEIPAPATSDDHLLYRDHAVPGVPGEPSQVGTGS